MEPWYIYIIYFVASMIFVSSILNILQRCLFPICCASAEEQFYNRQTQPVEEQSVRVSVVEPPPYIVANAPDYDTIIIEELPPPSYEDVIKSPIAPNR